MTGDQLAGVVGTGLCLTLSAAGLIARRLPAAMVAKLAAVWLAIVVGLVMILKRAI